MVEIQTERPAASVNLGVQIYNAFILIIDIVVLHVKMWISVVESIYKLFVLPEAREVSGDVVLITGTGHGIGQQLAFQYSSLGATVVCWDINEKLNLETVAAIKAKKGKAFAYTVDVTDYDQVKAKGKQVQTQIGDVTILVNNAGIMPTHPLLQQTKEEIRKVFDINVMAHFWLIQTFLPTMLDHNNGHIVALSSMAGIMGFPNLVPYCGTKFAVRGIMESINEEIRLDPRNINNVKVTSIYPYMVDTGLCKRPRMRFPKMMPMVRPDEAAAAIIDAQRRGVLEASIPKYLLYLNSFTRCYPAAAGLLLKDFFDTGVESDL